MNPKLQPKNILKTIHKGAGILEIISAILVFAAVVIAVIFLLPEYVTLFQSDHVLVAYQDILGGIFSVVIGIEFLKMLCRPNSDNVLEAVIFLVARHMIIADTSPLEDLLSTISIVLLVVTRTYLKKQRKQKSAGRELDVPEEESL